MKLIFGFLNLSQTGRGGDFSRDIARISGFGRWFRHKPPSPPPVSPEPDRHSPASRWWWCAWARCRGSSSRARRDCVMIFSASFLQRPTWPGLPQFGRADRLFCRLRHVLQCRFCRLQDFFDVIVQATGQGEYGGVRHPQGRPGLKFAFRQRFHPVPYRNRLARK